MTTQILLVEDDNTLAGDLQHRLESLGYQIVGLAADGEKAILQAAELAPDIILMAVELPGSIDGSTASTRIRSFSDVPIIYIAANQEQQHIVKTRNPGEFASLSHPFEDHDLRSVVEMALYKHSLERKLRESEERYALAVRAANDGIWDWNLKTNEIYFSTRWKEMLGYRENEVGNNPDEWFKRVHPDDQTQLQAYLASHLKGFSQNFECEYRIKHANGKYIWVLSRGLAVREAGDLPSRMAGSQSDISARKFAEERLAYDALHDSLTRLPNRTLFMDRLENRLAKTGRNPADLFAVIFLDLDRFKVVNDSLGHAVGDQLLITVAQRLKHCLRPEDTVSRLGGDEFAILLDSVKDITGALMVADRIKASLVATTLLGSVERSPTASIGIAMYNPTISSPGDMLRDADLAMYHAKALGGSRTQIFDESMHISAVELLKLESELKRGVARQEWQVYYQPIVAIESGETIGVEALVRWLHPLRGVVFPQEFIHTAEETGLIVAIGEFVLYEACRQTKIWRENGRPNLWVSVNISGRQFQDQNLVEMIRRVLRETGLPGDGLRLEVTESIAVRDMDYTIKILNEMNTLGVFASLDDFGTGYSSLNYLKRFPLKCLKIDQSFVQDIELNKKSESLTTAIIAMARSLGMEVVAEGVEKEEQLAFLRTNRCDNVQGFLMSHPISAVDLTRIFDNAVV